MGDSPLGPSGGEAFADFVAGVRADLAMPAQLQGVGYGTDASTCGQAGIPVVVLGPGDIAQGHTADAWLDVAELHRGVEVYAALMRTAAKD